MVNDGEFNLHLHKQRMCTLCCNKDLTYSLYDSVPRVHCTFRYFDRRSLVQNERKCIGACWTWISEQQTANKSIQENNGKFAEKNTRFYLPLSFVVCAWFCFDVLSTFFCRKKELKNICTKFIFFKHVPAKPTNAWMCLWAVDFSSCSSIIRIKFTNLHT